jgi:hypothetical protein
MSESAAPDRDPGAWGAATDPIGQQPDRTRPASAPADGTQLPGQVKPVNGVPGRAVSRGTIRDVSRPPQPRRPASRRPSSPGGDLLTDLQRWMIRSGAKSMRREIEGSVRRTLGGGRSKPEDIWGTATTEPPPGVGESPECAWCPICRAARRMRDSGPGLSSQISGASDVVASAVQDAIVAFDSVISRASATPATAPPAERADEAERDGAERAGAERAADEPGDRG